MDPLSIATATSSLVFTVVKNGRALAAIYEKYQDAQRCLFLMQTECTVLAAALSQLQVLFSRNSGARVREYPEGVLEALDLSLVGCTLTLSVLTKEIEGLTDGVEDLGKGQLGMGKGKRAKYVWKEEAMNELLLQLRGQSSALTLLLKAFDSSSIEQILRVMQSGQQTFQKVKRGAESIRSEYPEEKYAESILDMAFDDTKTIYSIDATVDSEPEIVVSKSLDPVPTSQSAALSLPFETTLPEGWKTQYSSQYKQWFYVNTYTRKSQWERPASSAPPPQMSIRSRSPNILPRKPVSPATTPGPFAPSPQNFSSAVANRTTLNDPEDYLDMKPWALNTDSKFHNALNNLRIDSSVAALAVGIVSAEKENRVYVMGVRKKDSSTPVTRADRFIVANSTHLITTMMAILVDRGVFSWEETVLTLFPRLAKRTHILNHETTLAMISAQQSGFLTGIGAAEGGELYTYCQQKGVSGREGRFATALSYLGRPPDQAPGTSYTWQWANVMLMILAIEERTSQSIETLTKALIFDPLEMYSSGFGRPDATRNGSSPENPTQPWGHSATTKEALNPTQAHLFNPLALEPIAGTHSSIPDLAAFVKMHLRGAMGLPTPVLNPPAFKKLHTRLGEVETGTLGSWSLAERDWAGGETIWTSGRSAGFAVSIWMAPLKGHAYFSIANIDGDVGLKVTDSAVYSAIRYDQS